MTKEDLIQQFKEQNNILDVAVNRLGLNVTRDNKILCPYHNEKGWTPRYV